MLRWWTSLQPKGTYCAGFQGVDFGQENRFRMLYLTPWSQYSSVGVAQLTLRPYYRGCLHIKKVPNSSSFFSLLSFKGVTLIGIQYRNIWNEECLMTRYGISGRQVLGGYLVDPSSSIWVLICSSHLNESLCCITAANNFDRKYQTALLWTMSRRMGYVSRQKYNLVIDHPWQHIIPSIALRWRNPSPTQSWLCADSAINPGFQKAQHSQIQHPLRYVGFLWSPFLSGRLYLSGVWQGCSNEWAHVLW